ncbi:chitinase 2-like [Elaeis guineensis]|uniref:Chitinase 2-like n=1 Tax=Elaeis guineensis var. tenera TaxID=51953 RepID=A0A6I9RUJ8_ELAGV|nr:chitinase 2-like [Elaeis guineensis]
MDFSKLFSYYFLLLALLFPMATAENSNLFREYIGAQDKGVKFTDVPINSDVQFHFILAFAIDYTTTTPYTPTNGQFNVFWDTVNLTPSAVASIKQSHSNVKVALSLAGYSVAGSTTNAYFLPTSIDSWVNNAVSSLTSIIEQYHLDGIDVDYENFNTSAADEDTFAECIGRLITTLKNNGVIQFASIAPFEDQPLQSYYEALWAKYSNVIDYVNFQFYGYSNSTTVSQFLGYYDTQSSNYEGGNILTSLISDDSGGLTPANGFFNACKTLQDEGRLFGIFIWSADSSKANGFPYETEAQDLLANA